jgi:hypothetical protein
MKILQGRKFPLLILIITLISYGQTLRMYFWQDDSALIFKLQNPTGKAGSFGYGIIGDGAYKYLVSFYYPFFQFFGTEPFGYFFVGFVTYIIATYFFYRWMKQFWLENYQAKIATLIFAAGYIGSDIMFRVINSWQTNIGLVLAFLTFEYLTKYLKSANKRNYLVSIIFYWMATEFVFIRSHSLILPLFILSFIYIFKDFKFRNFVKIVLLQSPFLAIFYYRYMRDEGFGGPGISSLVKEVLAGKFEVLTPLFANTGYSLFPTILQERLIKNFSNFIQPSEILNQLMGLHILVGLVFFGLYVILVSKPSLNIRKNLLMLIGIASGLLFNLYLYSKNPLWYRDIRTVFSGAWGIGFLILVCGLFFKHLKKRQFEVSAALFGVVFASSQIFGYFVQYPTAIFATTHRYYSYSLIGYAIFYTSLASLLLKKNGYRKKAGLLLIFSILASNLYLGFTYQSRLVEDRSKPSREFYTKLTHYVPEIEKDTAFYFDVSKEGRYGVQFGDFFSVGSMPESTGLAMYYGVDRYDVLFIAEFDELVYKIEKGEVEIDQLYTFYYGDDGLIDTTEDTRRLLKEGGANREYESLESIEILPYSPILMRTTMIASKSEFGASYSVANNLSIDVKRQILNYLVSRNEYYRNALVESESEWKYREVRNLIDNDVSTVWQGHRIYWHDNRREELIVDLGEIKNISSVLWRNWKVSLAPTSYTISTSIDKKNWEIVKEVKDGQERKEGEIVIEEVHPIDARFVRMTIYDTQTNDSPAILELEAIESKYGDIDIAYAIGYIGEPLSLASNEIEFSELYNYALPLATFKLSWETDKRDVYNQDSELPLIVDSRMHTYEIVIPAGGKSIRFKDIVTNIPTTLDIANITVRNMSVEELKARNLIQTFTEN